MASLRSVFVVVCVGVIWSASGAIAQEQHSRITTEWQLPRNIVAEESVAALLAELLPKSPTLRRQCERIGSTSRVVVTLNLTARMIGPGRARTTMFKYEAGFIRAIVDLPVGPDLVELLAHELEHVVEQLDGVDLHHLARAGRLAVFYQGVFETARARAAGLAAAREAHAGQRVSHP